MYVYMDVHKNFMYTFLQEHSWTTVLVVVSCMCPKENACSAYPNHIRPHNFVTTAKPTRVHTKQQQHQ